GPGEVIELGTVMLVIQAHVTAPRARRVWSHDAFEARLDEACAHGLRDRSTFAVLRLRVEDLPTPAIQDAVLEHLRPPDVVRGYGPTDVEILALDATAEIAERILRDMRDALSDRGGKVSGALASFPRDGKSADVLLGRACDALRDAG